VERLCWANGEKPRLVSESGDFDASNDRFFDRFYGIAIKQAIAQVQNLKIFRYQTANLLPLLGADLRRLHVSATD
jgi:hypothetical protein